MLNDLFLGTGAMIYEKHPNGDFDVKVVEVSMQKPEGKNPFVKVSMESRFGKTPDLRYNFVTENDAFQASQNPDTKKKLIAMIGYHKGTMIKLGLADENSVLSWDQQKIMSGYGFLRGKMVRVSISDDIKNPQYQRIVINGMAENPVQQQAKPEAKQSQFDMHTNMHASQPINPPNNAANLQQQANFNLPNSSFDDIPF